MAFRDRGGTAFGSVTGCSIARSVVVSIGRSLGSAHEHGVVIS
jgi:hypothetical protein